MSNKIYLYHLASNLTKTEGPGSQYGKTGGAPYTHTTDKADEVFIGYRGENGQGHLITSPWDGDFERDSDDSKDSIWTLDTAAGNDYVRIRDDQNPYTVTKLGTGNDTYEVVGSLNASLGETMRGNDDARSYVFTQEGNDKVSIGDIDGGRLFTGSGNDTVNIRGEMDDGGVIDLGSGKTKYANGHEEAKSADDSKAVNNLHIHGSLGESHAEKYGIVLGGKGKDNVIIDHEIEGRSVIDLGDNSDNVSVHHMQHTSKIITGSGNDVVNVKNSMFNDTLIDTSGEIRAGQPAIPAKTEKKYDPFLDKYVTIHTPGKPAVEASTDDDIVNIGYSTIGNSVIQVGDGKNQIKIGNDIDGNSRIFAGKHNDILTVGDDIENTAAVDLGAGNNTIKVGSQIGGLSTVTTGDGNDVLEVGAAIATQSKVNLGNGNNTIRVGNDVDDMAKITTGKGNDKLIIGDDVENRATINLGDGNNKISVAHQVGGVSQINTGKGNDVLKVGDSIATHSQINLGDGKNTITVGDDVDDRAEITTGKGNDKLTVGDDIENHANINLGEGNNTINVVDQVGGASQITTGAGNDSLNIGYALASSANVNLGDGKNTITVGDDVDGNSKLTTGKGNDKLVVKDDIEDTAHINLGDGNNQIIIAGDVEDRGSVVTGSGDDKVSVDGSLYNFGSINVGAGNDSVTIGKGMFNRGYVSGGEGKDTLNFTFDDNDSQVTAHQHVTGLSTESFSGFETIELKGHNALDVRYEDLVNDTDRDGALFVNGNDHSKVDLGSTNWNSDNASRASMSDHTGGQWNKVGTETVNGHEYDVYHNSLANDASNNVYIEQGIVVI